MSDQDHQQNKDNQAELSPILSNEERREALKKIGLYAAISAPLMVGLLKADKALANPSPL